MFRRFLIFVLFWQAIIITHCRGGEEAVRKPAHAGRFYPGEKDELREMVDSMLRDARSRMLSGRVVLMIVPHAGYIYSGPVASYAYKLIKEISPRRIILLGPSHYYPIDSVTLYGYGSFSTPLGEVPVSTHLTDRLKEMCRGIRVSPEAHRMEHSLEVQIPFLQRVLSDFEIVPVLVPPHRSMQDESELAKALAELLKEDKELIILASSDLSHFHPYQEARKIDGDTVDLIKRMDIERLGKGILQNRNELCGDGAVLTGMLAARSFGADKVEVLSFANSGDTQGDKSRVVGYVAVAFYKSGDNGRNDRGISEDTKKEILYIARKTIEEYLNKKKIPEITPKSSILKERRRGVFVTLMKHGILRGCIGCFEPEGTLLESLQRMAVASATQDYRFPAVRAGELEDIEIEVSILSPLRKIKSLDEFMIGKHGIYMRKAGRSATFLPQVATEQGWDKDETLKHLSLKAGLGEDGWKDGAEFYVYTTTILKEDLDK